MHARATLQTRYRNSLNENAFAANTINALAANRLRKQTRMSRSCESPCRPIHRFATPNRGFTLTPSGITVRTSTSLLLDRTCRTRPDRFDGLVIEGRQKHSMIGTSLDDPLPTDGGTHALGVT